MNTITPASPPAADGRPQPVAAEVERVIAASPQRLYDLVTDVTRMGEWSPETTSARWVKGATHAEVGARFTGTNRLGKNSWSTTPEVVVAERGTEFTFKVPGKSGPRWSYRFEQVDGGTLVTESVQQDRRSPAPIRWLQRRAGVTDRSAHLADGMAVTLDRLALVAETN